MFGWEKLKKKLEIINTAIECPVEGCATKVKKMKKGDPNLLDSYLKRRKPGEKKQRFEDYICKEHKIYVTPSTFIYDDYNNNLLWHDSEDIKLLENILKIKRVKAQLHHDNSEDAVTWNVFRFLERNKLVDGFLSSQVGKELKSAEVIYWSHSQKENDTWSPLSEARKEFGETKQRGSEPDIIIVTDKALFFIESKLTAGNVTNPTDKSNSRKYETGCHNWFSKVFWQNYQTIAKDEKKYELMRFWLLGTWIAEYQDLDFYLINLVPSEKEKDIERIFKKLIKENERRTFRRLAWEDIYHFISKGSLTKDNEIMLNYFRNKTIGYKNRKLQGAFFIPNNGT